MTVTKFLRGIAVLVAVSTMTAAASATPIPTLWGIDEDDGQLFSIGDYTNVAGTFTDYGKLQYNGSNVGAHIEAFTIDPTGKGYLAINKNFAGYNEPVFASFQLPAPSVTDPITISIIGRITVNFNASEDNISGLGFDPLTGMLVGLFRDAGTSDKDYLIDIDPLTGVASNMRSMSGLSQKVTDGEDMTFDLTGNLFVADNKDDHLYRIDAATGNIVEVIDANMKGGLGVSSIKVEGLAYDPVNGVIIGSDDDNNMLVMINPGTGGNTLLGDLKSLGITDAESLYFIPTPTGTIPEPASMALLGLGALMVWPSRKRRHHNA